jgi:hypothetical protein
MFVLSTTRLAELISKRRKCLAQLRELVVKQGELIADGNMTALLRIFSAKQELIAALETLERELRPYHDDDPDDRQWSSPAARAACAADAEACRRLLAEVMALEQAGERQMTIRRDGAAQELRSLSEAGRVREAYQANR